MEMEFECLINQTDLDGEENDDDAEINVIQSLWAHELVMEQKISPLPTKPTRNDLGHVLKIIIS